MMRTESELVFQKPTEIDRAYLIEIERQFVYWNLYICLKDIHIVLFFF